MMLFLVVLVLILIAVGLAWYLLARDRGAKEPVGALWLAVGFGFAGSIIAVIAELFLVPSSGLLPGASFQTLLLSSFEVGAIEEICKFVPLAIFLYPKSYFNEHTDGVIYFALAGIGFGLPENILYSLEFGSATGLGRIILTPFFHAAITGMVGYFLIRAKLARRSVWGVGAILLIAIVAHGLYDFGLTSGVLIYALLSVLVTMMLSVGLFVLYHRATKLDQKDGLSAVGSNNFCRACGTANPRHELYCTHCGSYA